ncbi:SDR family oxidoreductase [Alkalicoccobacillus porphyridii]|uniref:SDR family oxidoreductase n=1 Tax=Alkalicoccobacillus porphyridii TaxID=2597270 RepID=A0A554A218_9BACI|nr:SDR family oxidoreductase [Alkalicoccobacillus porphyridii]TSB47730.1 SDR family oxidoreductase [Alkalicoccobacillus porphyridii]
MAKTIFITGAGTGLGKGTALGLAKQGHKVIAAVENLPQITSLREVAKKEGVELEVIKLDIRNKRDQSLINEFDFDVFVANAAIGEGGPLAEIPVDRVRDIYETNVFSTLETAQHAAKQFIKKKSGKIVFLSSIVGIVAMPYLGAYSSTKHAVEAIAKTLRAELKEFNVQVATINPGPFETGFNDRMFEERWKWYDSDKNFTPESSISEQEEILDQQHDPEEMIAKMVEVIPADHHPFRTAFPQSTEDQMKETELEVWKDEV